MKKRIVFIVIILVLFGSIGFVLARNKKQIDAQKVVVDRSHVPVAVSVSKVSLQKLDGTLLLPATLEPSRQAEISATTGGKITSLRIATGTRVSEGQVIGMIDTRAQQLNMKDAQEALAKAQHDLQLSKELYEGNAGTAQSVTDARHALDAARIRVQQSDRQVNEGAIRSPISGIVTDKKGEAGEYASPGTPLATVVDIYSLKAVVFVGEKDVYQLKMNQSANITADVLPGQTIAGKVSFISPVGDANHNYRVELTVDNRNATLKAGPYIKVAFAPGNSYNALQIPKIALVEGVKNPYVYVVKDDRANVRKITIGREAGEYVEVLTGLQDGEEVVITGQINLVDGSMVSKTKKD